MRISDWSSDVCSSDLPEEADGFREPFAAAGVALVLLASPTTTDARLEALCAQVRGYLYYVSFAGVTGASDQLDPRAASAPLRTIRGMSRASVVAGFGIPDAARPSPIALDAAGVGAEERRVRKYGVRRSK